MYKSLTLALIATLSSAAFSAPNRIDYDLDDDGLIEVNDLLDLNEIRNNLDGSSLYGSSEGCPIAGCKGFELTSDLDFDTNGDGTLDEQDAFWNNGQGWEPLGIRFDAPFTGVFRGNFYVINNLMINRPESDQPVGLFTYAENATIGQVGINGPLASIKGKSVVGSLVGHALNTRLTESWSTADVEASWQMAGGLVAIAGGTKSYIDSCFYIGNVSIDTDMLSEQAGGIAGFLFDSTVVSSFASGSVSGGHFVGGLVGMKANTRIYGSFSSNTVSGSPGSGIAGERPYADHLNFYVDGKTGVGVYGSQGSTAGTEITLPQVQCPTSANDTNCSAFVLYAGWDTLQDDYGLPYWDFGSTTQLPGLRLNNQIYRDGDADGEMDEVVQAPAIEPEPTPDWDKNTRVIDYSGGGGSSTPSFLLLLILPAIFRRLRRVD